MRPDDAFPSELTHDEIIEAYFEGAEDEGCVISDVPLFDEAETEVSNEDMVLP